MDYNILFARFSNRPAFKSDFKQPDGSDIVFANQQLFINTQNLFTMSEKQTYYFSHDFNASDDVKMLFLRQELGVEGLGIYWYIIEKLAQAGGRLPLKILPVLSMQMQVSETKANAVVQSFDLFVLDTVDFFSQRLVKSLENFKELREARSEGGRRGMQSRWGKKDNGEKKMVL